MCAQTGDAVKEQDGKEEREITRDEFQCPEGWLWKDEWKVDMGRAVDDEGWEYAIEAGMGNWVPYERNGYLFRRRRCVRLRVRDRNAKVLQKKKVCVCLSPSVSVVLSVYCVYVCPCTFSLCVL